MSASLTLSGVCLQEVHHDGLSSWQEQDTAVLPATRHPTLATQEQRGAHSTGLATAALAALDVVQEPCVGQVGLSSNGHVT